MTGPLPNAPAPETSAPETSAPYRLKTYVDDSTLNAAFRSASALKALADRPPATRRGLERRVRGDEELFRKILRAHGHYAGTVTGTIRPPEEEGGYWKVRIRAEPGPLYRLEPVKLYGVPEEIDVRSVFADIRPDMPAATEAVLGAGEELLRVVVKAGYPLARIRKRSTVVDHESTTMRVRFHLNPGPQARFGPVSVEGLSSIKERYVERRINLPRGELFDPALVEESRNRLMEGGAFASVRIEHAASLDEDGLLPLVVHLTEKKPRTLGAGVKYSSSAGGGARAYWEHRNLMGGAERLRLTTNASQIGSSVGADYREPDFLVTSQDLLLEAVVGTDDTDAFYRRSLRIAAGVERRLGSQVLGGIGVSLEQSFIDDHEGGGDEDFTLVGFPTRLRYDGTDDLLDPSRGMRASVNITPYHDIAGGTRNMVVSELSLSAYAPVPGTERVVLAGRARGGSIFGLGRDSIPADKRFYAGGGDSVRGYDFQLAGPLDCDVAGETTGCNDPVGGRSLFQVGMEARVRVTQTIGVVPFFEGAGVYENKIPQNLDEMFWGAGLGLRFYTPAGPFRIDAAVPLDRRDGVDSAFEVYLSLGQAF